MSGRGGGRVVDKLVESAYLASPSSELNWKAFIEIPLKEYLLNHKHTEMSYYPSTRNNIDLYKVNI